MTSPESSASAGSPVRRIASTALIVAFSANVEPLSIGSNATPSWLGVVSSKPQPARSCSNSRSLPALFVAITSRRESLPVSADTSLWSRLQDVDERIRNHAIAGVGWVRVEGRIEDMRQLSTASVEGRRRIGDGGVRVLRLDAAV